MSNSLDSKIEEIKEEISKVNKEIFLLKRQIDNLETKRIGLSLEKDKCEEQLQKIRMNVKE